MSFSLIRWGLCRELGNCRGSFWVFLYLVCWLAGEGDWLVLADWVVVGFHGVVGCSFDFLGLGSKCLVRVQSGWAVRCMLDVLRGFGG